MGSFCLWWAWDRIALMQTEQTSQKILIIRLSSFGDIVQAMSTLPALRTRFPLAQIDWLVRSDNQSVLRCSPNIHTIWSFDRKSGLKGLIELARKLKAQNYTHVYDAHSNMRSRIVCLFLTPSHFIRRSKERWKRFLLFKLRVNKFPWPYQGMRSYSSPLTAWGVMGQGDLQEQWNFTSAQKDKVHRLLGSRSYVALVPSAAWPMKRWPLSHWAQLIKNCPETNFALLGGPGDDFLKELEQLAPERILNLAGALSLAESCYVTSLCQAVVSADTGLLHVADLLGVRALALIGPTAFGFPTNVQVKTLEVDLPCRPCTKDGRGQCVQDVYQKCMVDITPARVALELKQLLG